MGFLETYSRIKEYLDRAENLYRKAQENNRDDPLEIALPILYEFARKREDLVDSRITSFTGQYLACEYPHLIDEFIDERQLNTQQEYIGVLRETLQKKQQEETPAQETMNEQPTTIGQHPVYRQQTPDMQIHANKEEKLERRIRILS